MTSSRIDFIIKHFLFILIHLFGFVYSINSKAELIEIQKQKFSFYSENQFNQRFGYLTDTKFKYEISDDLFLFQFVGHHRRQNTISKTDQMMFEKPESWLSFRAEKNIQPWLTWRSDFSSNSLSYHGFFLNQEWQEKIQSQLYFLSIYGEYFLFPRYSWNKTSNLQLKIGPTWQLTENQITKVFAGYQYQNATLQDLGFKNSEYKIGVQWSVHIQKQFWLHTFFIYQISAEIENKNQLFLILEGRF